eukprot:327001_1
MMRKVLTSKYTICTVAGTTGISILYHGHYQQKHIIRSSYAFNLLNELYVTNHENNPEITCNKIGIIVFDGVCNICNNGIKFVDKYENKKGNKLYVAWSQNEDVSKPLLRNLNISDQSIYNRFAFIEYDMKHNNLRLYRGSSAALQIATYLRFPLNISVAGIIIPEPFRDWIYDIVARNRYQWFGRTDKCQINQTKRVMGIFIHKIE